MLYLLVKAGISGLLVAIISEVARRQPGWGGLLASLPQPQSRLKILSLKRRKLVYAATLCHPVQIAPVRWQRLRHRQLLVLRLSPCLYPFRACRFEQ